MRKRTTRKVVYYVFKSFLAVSIAVVASVGAMLPLDLDSPFAPKNALLVRLIQLVQVWGWLALLIFSGLTFFADLISRWMGRPWVWSAIECVVGTLKSHAFSLEAAGVGDHEHYHRVTLFRRKACKVWIWPWRGMTPWGTDRKGKLATPFSGWMVPVSRSGHTTQKTNAVFLAPDDGDCVEGIAGQTWSVKGVILEDDLPKIDSNSSEADVQKYARRTWISEKVVRDRLDRGKVLPQALCGVPVFVNNKPWGAVVLDSRRADGIKPIQSNTVAFKITQDFLDNLLSK